MKKILLSILLLCISIGGFSQTFKSLLDKGDEYYTDGDYENAVVYFTKAINIDPKNDTGYWYRGDAYVKLLKRELAISDFSMAIKLKPSEYYYYKKRGDCYYNMEKYNLSEIDYGKAIELNPTNSLLWLYRGDAYRLLNQTENACSDYQKAYSLEEKDALKQAIKLGCEWSKGLSTEVKCPPISSYISNKVDPFTGASFISKGISFKKYELLKTSNDLYLVDNVMGKDEEITIKILKPKGFCADAEGNIFFGTGYSLFDDKGMELGNVEDIYEKSETGYPADVVNYMSMKVSFSKLEIGKNYVLNVRFFDKRSKAELLFVFPFVFKAKLPTSSNINSTEGVLGIGVASKSLTANVESMKLTIAGDTNLVEIYKMGHTKSYNLQLNQVENLSAQTNYTVIFISEDGKYYPSQASKVDVKGNIFLLKFSVPDIPKGGYTVLVKLWDAKGEIYNFVLPTYVK